MRYAISLFGIMQICRRVGDTVVEFSDLHYR